MAFMVVLLMVGRRRNLVLGEGKCKLAGLERVGLPCCEFSESINFCGQRAALSWWPAALKGRGDMMLR
jgi:hypothetical protein